MINAKTDIFEISQLVDETTKLMTNLGYRISSTTLKPTGSYYSTEITLVYRNFNKNEEHDIKFVWKLQDRDFSYTIQPIGIKSTTEVSKIHDKIKNVFSQMYESKFRK